MFDLRQTEEHSVKRQSEGCLGGPASRSKLFGVSEKTNRRKVEMLSNSPILTARMVAETTRKIMSMGSVRETMLETT